MFAASCSCFVHVWLCSEPIRQTQIIPADIFPVKALCELCKGCRAVLLKDAAGIGERAQNLLRRIPLRQRRKIQILVSLGEPSALAVRQQGDVIKRGRRKAQRFKQLNLPGRGEENVPPANDFVYAGERIVDDHRQLIAPQAV